ncbi:MAG: DMT family transporter [Rhizobiales bacterium]|nr:DMT family transporter [Hyphomicrobiales bacterium]
MPATPQVRYPAVQLALALAVSASVGAFAHEAGIDAMTTVFWRCAFGALFLCCWSLAFGHLDRERMSRGNLAASALAGAFLALCWVCLFSAFRMTSIATATLVFQSYPFILVIAGAIVWRDQVSRDQILWMVMAFAGVALASGALGGHHEEGAGWLLGLVLTIVSAGAYVVTTMITRAIRNQRPEVTMMMQAATGAVLLAGLADFHQDVSVASWGWLIGMGVIHTGLVMVAMYATFPLLATPVIAIMNFVYPAVVILIDWMIYDKLLSPWQFAGVALIAVATLGLNLKWRLLPAAP